MCSSWRNTPPPSHFYFISLVHIHNSITSLDSCIGGFGWGEGGERQQQVQFRHVHILLWTRKTGDLWAEEYECLLTLRHSSWSGKWYGIKYVWVSAWTVYSGMGDNPGGTMQLYQITHNQCQIKMIKLQSLDINWFYSCSCHTPVSQNMNQWKLDRISLA